ncbi:hypothetical protein Kpol_1013p74 [Vanderwaltozyma polyspora DSM 70294]|uniref:Uncharacterized protein n=1 Tax=Vanderwaltozyma polyspora (strain ATCC 22028 / DSM 70294 / BCRC 21397 / CBS 2163 / NBRC 10782 / NRRL Y-8283 / UCD 57-17) TaxID=436907 RepID=A7THB8_VANPO|nr:uncharacterized protein Kpol_1013p74 [Vanderwaltozyma polyspora DSM 70294]EDO18399.1 hypothetical protein Kpol_1013p74 [Vanderwaltozyma polyspora DSM 70294]
MGAQLNPTMTDIAEQCKLASKVRCKLNECGNPSSGNGRKKSFDLRVLVGHANLLDRVMDNILYCNRVQSKSFPENSDINENEIEESTQVIMNKPILPLSKSLKLSDLDNKVEFSPLYCDNKIEEDAIQLEQELDICDEDDDENDYLEKPEKQEENVDDDSNDSYDSDEFDSNNFDYEDTDYDYVEDSDSTLVPLLKYNTDITKDNLIDPISPSSAFTLSNPNYSYLPVQNNPYEGDNDTDKDDLSLPNFKRVDRSVHA